MFPQIDPGVSRRSFLLKSSGLCSGLLLTSASKSTEAAEKLTGASLPAEQTHSDVGSLFPIIESEAIKSDFPLSFLNPRFKSVKRWKKAARGKLLELLHYAPAACDPRTELVEKVDTDGYIREKIYFNTTPAIRVPAYLLIPKNGKKRSPAIVALHDHGGFYLWGKEKLVETDDEPAVLKNWRKTYYGDKSVASVLARQGYVVLVIDMFYWGERRMLLDDDPADWRERPNTISNERINAFNQRSGQSEQLLGRTI